METANKPSQGQDSCEPRHLELDRAINNIDSVLEQVNSLKRRVVNEEVKGAEVDNIKPPQPSLIEVLNGSGCRINDKLGQIHQAISELEALFF